MADRKIMIPAELVNENDLVKYNQEFYEELASNGKANNLTAAQHFTMLGIMAGTGLSDKYRDVVIRLADGQNSRDSFLTAALRVKDYVDGLVQSDEDSGEETSESDIVDRVQSWVLSIVSRRATRTLKAKLPLDATELRTIATLLVDYCTVHTSMASSDLAAARDFKDRLRNLALRIDAGNAVWA
jgi:hypothetical protein